MRETDRYTGPERRSVPRDAGGKPPCPICQHDKSDVIRAGMELFKHAPLGMYPRRRECSACHYRWVTYEGNAKVTISTTSGLAEPVR